ncbi:MAG: tyrosine-type recombinase/integrase [Bacteroidota bacterium]
MAKVNLPYVQLFKTRHGKWIAYYRRDGHQFRIQGEIGSAGFLAAYTRIHQGWSREPVNPARNVINEQGTFDALVKAYYAGANYHQCEASTKDEYRRHIEAMREKFGPFALSAITKRVVITYRDGFLDQPVTGNNRLRMLKRLFEWGRKNDVPGVGDNPCADVDFLKVKSDGWKPWPVAALERFARDSKGAPRVAFFLALYSGQRRADVLTMRWDSIVDGGITLKQAKTGAELWIPIHPILADELEQVRREQTLRAEARAARNLQAAHGMTIVQRENGAPYTEDGFGTVWNREQHRVGCAGLPFHGLRKNATVAMFEAGCTPQQVQAITGHETLEMVQHYGKGARQKLLAKEAMKRLTGESDDGTHEER